MLICSAFDGHSHIGKLTIMVSGGGGGITV